MESFVQDALKFKEKEQLSSRPQAARLKRWMNSEHQRS